MLTMIGLARSPPMTKPCAPVMQPPSEKGGDAAGGKSGLVEHGDEHYRCRRRGRPRLNDMMFPLIVINVMPAATQPTNESVVSKASRLGADRNPGVLIATSPSVAMTTMRTVATTRRRDRVTDRGSGGASAAAHCSASERSLFTPRLPSIRWDA